MLNGPEPIEVGEELKPFKGLGIINVSQLGPYTIKLSWTGSNANNYRVYGTSELQAPVYNWVPVADSSVPDSSGAASVSLNVAAAPNPVFMQVASLPWVNYP